MTTATRTDRFLDGRLVIHQPAQGYRAATDPVLLAAATPARPGEAVLDLGCGVGTAALCLGARVGGVSLTGLEIQPAYASLARRNAAENGIALEVIEGDVTDMPQALRARTFACVMLNPPYFPHHDLPSPVPGRDVANRETGARLADWLDAALRRLSPRGRLTIIHRAERLGEILAALDGRAGEIAVLPLAAREGRDAGRVIVRARKGVRTPLRLAAPFVLHAGTAHLEDGDDFTPEARTILRDGAPLNL